MTAGRSVRLAWGITLAVIAVLGCSVLCNAQEAEPATKELGPAQGQLYPFQKDLEAHLKGSAEERERYAALLPLRIALAKSATDATAHSTMRTPGGGEVLGNYFADILAYIDKNNVREAIPLLERALHPYMPLYGGFKGKEPVARVWIKLKTQGMTPNEKAAFLASLLGPGLPYEAHTEAPAGLEALGQEGKNALVKMLADATSEMVKGDGMNAVMVGDLLHRVPEFAITEAEVEKLLKNDNGYVRMVMCMYLAMKDDKRAVKLFEEVWKKYPTGHESLTRTAILGNPVVATVEGSGPVLLKCLQGLDAEPQNEATCHLRVFVIAAIRDGGKSTMLPEIRRYLEAYLKRPLELPKPLSTDKCRALQSETIARGCAEATLSQWDFLVKESGATEGKKDEHEVGKGSKDNGR